MNTVRSHVPDTELAVFAKNHRRHLDEAAQASQRDPASKRTFRSRKRWVTAARVVAQHGPIPIYFAVVDSEPIIEFEADLIDVYVDPDQTDPRAKELLRYSGDTTRDEGLWKDSVKTLYLISRCKKVTTGFPQSQLLKFEGGEPLAANYRRPYARVRRRGESA